VASGWLGAAVTGFSRFEVSQIEAEPNRGLALGISLSAFRFPLSSLTGISAFYFLLSTFCFAPAAFSFQYFSISVFQLLPVLCAFLFPPSTI
jgi:hypothetical protein